MNKILNNKKFYFGIIISILLLYFVIKDFNYLNFKIHIINMNYFYILYSLIILIFVIYIRAIRWSYFFEKKTSRNLLYKAQYIGYFGNNILPFRLGEILRAFYLGSKENESKSKVMGTIILERIFDFIGCGILFLIIINSTLFNLLEYQYIYAVIIINILGFLVVLCALSFKSIFLKKTDSKIKRILNDVIDGLSNIKKEKIMPAILTTFLIWAFYTIEVYFVQSAFNLNLDIIQCMIILLISSIAMMIPAMPGNFGTFESAVIYSLSLFHIVDNFGFCFMLHLVSYIPYTFLGFIYFLEEFNLNNITKAINSGTLK